MTLSDFENMTVGAIEDVITVYINYMNKINTKHDNNGSGGIREATQADFDKFGL